MDHKYEWQLIEFLENKTEEGVPYVDCVPYSWLIYNQETKTLLCSYPPPPYTTQICENLQQEIKERNYPEKKWPLWNVTLRGGAGIIYTTVFSSY